MCVYIYRIKWKTVFLAKLKKSLQASSLKKFILSKNVLVWLYRN